MTGHSTRVPHRKIRLTLYLQRSSGRLNYRYVEAMTPPSNPSPSSTRNTLALLNPTGQFRSPAIPKHPDTPPQSSPFKLPWTLPPTPSTSPAPPGMPGPAQMAGAKTSRAPGKTWAPSLVNATISTPSLRERGSRAWPGRVAAASAGPGWMPESMLWSVVRDAEECKAMMGPCTIIDGNGLLSLSSPLLSD